MFLINNFERQIRSLVGSIRTTGGFEFDSNPASSSNRGVDQKKLKTHNFRKLEENIDYFVDFAESRKVATLTTAYRVKRGEKIILLDREQPFTYYVEEIESYWNDDDIQTILLRRIEKFA